MSKPAFNAFVPQETEQNGDKKTFWHKVGAAWPNKNEGFTLFIIPGISVSGKIVLMPFKENEEQQPSSPPINF
ncbi:hypothetical protein [Pantoea ananatis]|uniref:hypothetical protein n=1 Tax=Pantoea ananas TaxID=553 RepID=UPI001B315BD1|nr:hypothetical protein [Pantoea ananatis]